MQLDSALRCVAAAALVGVALVVLGSAAPTAQGQTNFVHDGEAGFVVTYFDVGLAAQDAAQTGACPTGLSQSYRDLVTASAEGRQRDDETELEHARRIAQTARQMALFPDGQMICMNPQAGGDITGHRNMVGRNIAVQGIDLDGQDSRANGRTAPESCAHDDFRGLNGERGVDYQLLRAMGCMRKFQPSAHTNGYTQELLAGSWGMLLTVSGIDDLRNDDDVEVSFYSNADPIQIGAAGAPLPNASYASVQDPRFRSTTHGRIVNGVLTSDPVDVRIRYVIVDLRMERVLNQARVRLNVSSHGGLDGILAGYTPIDNAYDVDFGFRSALGANGQPTDYRFQVARGNPDNTGFTCQGIYRALHEVADGDRDPATGRCTSVSTQYHIRAVPAFVLDAETQSLNAAVGREPAVR